MTGGSLQIGASNTKKLGYLVTKSWKEGKCFYEC